jgi:hypothetical protein
MQTAQDRLLLALAEQLKLPLVQIAHQSGLIRSADATEIQHTAQSALRVIDTFVLAITRDQTTLRLEPLSLSAVLQDTAQLLYSHAKRYDCELIVDVRGRNTPVMADAARVRAAFLALGHTFIESQQGSRNSQLILGTHKTKNGQVAGVYSPSSLVTAKSYRGAKNLFGTSTQPFAALGSLGGSGIFIADTLLQSFQTELITSSHRRVRGLAAVFLPSSQLSLVSA